MGCSPTGEPMPKVKLPDGSEREYETLTDVLQDSPGIKEAVLVYRWTYEHAEIEDENGTVFEYVYDQIDDEYSYIGPADGLEKFSKDYEGIWDDASLNLDGDGTLTGFFEAHDYSNDEYPSDSIPDNADGATLTTIVLPSGKEVRII